MQRTPEEENLLFKGRSSETVLEGTAVGVALQCAYPIRRNENFAWLHGQTPASTLLRSRNL